MSKPENKLTRLEVYKRIDGERNYQDSLWNSATTVSDGQHSPEEWLMYIEDYLNEAKHILSRNAVQVGYPQAMNIMRKIAGMTVCALEQHGCDHRKGFEIF